MTKSRHLTCVAGNYLSLGPSGRRRGNYSSELSGESELPFGRRQTVQRAGGLPRRSSPGPAGPLTCRRRKIGAHDALPSCRRFCVFWESAVWYHQNDNERSRGRHQGHPRSPDQVRAIVCRLDRIRNRRASKIAEIFPVLSSRHPHLPPQLEQNLLLSLADCLAADAPFPGQIDRPRSGRPRRAGRSGLGQRTKVPGIGSASRPRLERGVSPPSGPTPLVGFPPHGLRGRPVRATVSRPWSRLPALTYGWRSARSLGEEWTFLLRMTTPLALSCIPCCPSP